MSGPLAGLRVLDIATIIAPFAATLLADYGPEVLKIEMPGSGDGVRSFPPFKEGKPLWWKAANRNKKFATLDLREAGDRIWTEWAVFGSAWICAHFRSHGRPDLHHR